MAKASKSMAQDAVDHYSQWWAFLFLLLLSVITLFLPLHPSLTFKSTPIATALTGNDANRSASQKSKATTQPDYPVFIANCWCPAQFTGAHVDYTNAVCSSALNEMIRGRNSTSAGVYRLLGSTDFLDIDNLPEPLTPSDFLSPESDQMPESAGESIDRKKLEMGIEKLQAQRDTLHEGIMNLVGYKTALALFLFAVCLRLPHAVYSLLSTCCGCVNVDKTLETVQTLMMMEAKSRNTIREDIASSIKSPSKKASLLYLLTKLLMVVVLCGEAVIVGYTLLPETTRLENDLVKVDTMGRAIRFEMAESSGQRSAQTPAKTKTDKEDSQETGINADVFLCDLRIRQLEMEHHYTFQCVFRKAPLGESVDDGGSQGGDNDKVTLHQTSSLDSRSASGSEEQVLLLYKALFTMVLALLVLLAVFNVASLGTWMAKLLLGVCQPSSLVLRNDATMDLVLLVSMAWYNASPLVAMEIAKAAPGGEDKLMPKEADEADASC